MASLHDVQVGDHLCVRTRHNVLKAAVSAVTKTRVKVAGGRAYLRSTGRRVGDTFYSTYSSDVAERWDDAVHNPLQEQLENKRLLGLYRAQLEQVRWRNITDEQAVALFNLACSHNLVAPIRALNNTEL